MTQFEQMHKAVELAQAVTGLTADQVIFSDTAYRYLELVQDRFGMPDEVEIIEPEPEHDAG
ncbi:MAG: hypothetical protein WCY09_09720, partial [Candidatus Omnitrophota bacterium]